MNTGKGRFTVERSFESDPISTRATTARLQGLLGPDVPWVWSSEGYLDTLPGVVVPPPGRAQAAWQTSRGAAIYQRIQPLAASLLVPGYGAIANQLELQPGQTVVDVGCGPGNVTVRLADAVGPNGLAVGVDLSAPMLARAAHQARPNMGLVRGDATHLPLRDHSVDAACATAVIMLVPEPVDALAEMVRIVTPGGWVLVMVPCRPTGARAALTGPLIDLLGRVSGARMFGPEELSSLLEDLGCDRTHSYLRCNMLTVRARTRVSPSAPQSSSSGDATPTSD